MMSETTKSSVRTGPKPVNVFYVWYTELCRRLNSNPAPIVKPAKPKCETVLDFVGDRLKVEEWSPVINALRHDTSLHVINIRSRIGNCQFLHDVDTEEKARRMKRRYGSLWTAYILKSLLKSLSFSVRNTQVLTCLELDGLPMFSQYLEPLLQALKKNKTIKSLSLSHCAIKDLGCQMVCAYLRFTPNVEILNLSGCSLTHESGEYIGKLIKYQQINRYCESWHNSLRYENPERGGMRGLKRITLNINPSIGDQGLDFILRELEDDLWIKALDMQKCGITDEMANKIIDIIQYNTSLEIADFRHNELSVITVDKILQVFKDRQSFGFEPEYQWCNTALTVSWDSIRDSSKTCNSVCTNNNLVKSKSAPLKKAPSSKFSGVTFEKIKKSQTADNVQKRNGVTKITTYNKPTINDVQLQVQQLNSKLKEEVNKRLETERRNKELQHTIDEIRSVTSSEKNSDSNQNLKAILQAIQNLKPTSGSQVPMLKSAEQSATSLTKNSQSPEEFNLKNGYHKNGLVTKNGIKPLYANGFSKSLMNSACNIFEKILTKNKIEDYSDDEDLINYYVNGPDLSKIRKNCEQYIKNNDMSSSQVSLFRFMEELKNDNPNSSLNFKNRSSTSKYYITERKSSKK